MEQEAVVPGLVERVDHLTAAVADLGFRLDTLISSTAAFRDAVSDRLTDYADLVARWSMEAEENVASYRDTVGGLPAAVADELTAALAKVERRTAEAMEALESAVTRRLESVGGDVRGLRQALDALAAAGDDEDEGAPIADALSAVLAEVVALRNEVRAIPTPEPVVIPPFPEMPEVVVPPFPEIPPPPDLAPLAAEVAELRRAIEAIPVSEPVEFPPPPEPVDLSPLAAELAALREEVAALHPAEVDATVEELRGLRREIARLPQGREELAALAEEVRGLRATVAEAAADEVEDAEETEGALEGLTAEVAALREALAAVQVRLDERPAVPPEVTALTAELQSLRAELQEGPDDELPPAAPAAPVVVPAPVDLEPVQDAIAELTFEVRALRKRLRLKAE